MYVKDFQESIHWFKKPITIRIWFKKNQENRSVTIDRCERVDFHQNGTIIVISSGCSYSYFIGIIERFELLKRFNKAVPIFEDCMERNFSFNYNKIW